MPVVRERRYLRLSLPVPTRTRPVARVVSVALTLALVALLWHRPAVGLVVLWGLVIPLLPLWWYAAPGLWRNVCPLAAVNQLPRALGLTRARPLPRWLRDHGYLLALLAFLGVLAARKAGLDHNAAALGGLTLGLLALALAGGAQFAGKSGWCGTICPLRTVQDLYARAPVTHAESACEPCVGCMTGCPDLEPAARRRGIGEPDQSLNTRRRVLMAGVLPGLILGFYTTPAALDAVPRVALCTLAGVGVAFALESVLQVSPRLLAILSGAVSLNLFYWFNAPLMIEALGLLLMLGSPDLGIWIIRDNVLLLTLVTVARALREPAATSLPTPVTSTVRGIPITRCAASRREAPGAVAASQDVTVTIDGHAVGVPAGARLADACDLAGAGAGVGCGSGLCGSDPVFVASGSESLSAPTETELRTLRRLGLSPTARLACSAVVTGAVEIILHPPEVGADRILATAALAAHAPRRFVIVGGGIAAVTAAEELRSLAPDVVITVVAGEDRPLYNRMAVGDLLSAPDGEDALDLRDASWAEGHGVSLRGGATAIRVDASSRSVLLADGERIGYDRLILATGARATPLTAPGSQLPGVHGLRSAQHAVTIGKRLASGDVRQAIVVGGGPLAVETAVGLRKAGIAVTLIVRDAHLMSSHLDPPAAGLLAASLSDLGVLVVVHAELEALTGRDRVEQVILRDGTTLEGELVIACIGVTPNAELGLTAGLTVREGVVVDDRLRTSDPGILAAGDVTELDGARLWDNAERQGRIAARNAIGADEPYEPGADAMRLKLADVSVFSVGHRGEDEPLVVEDAQIGSYRRLDSTGGRLTGAILVEARAWERAATRAVERRLDVTVLRPSLVAGDWSALLDRPRVPALR